MKASMPTAVGKGRRVYGLTICDGVCCARNLTKKSNVSMKGNVAHRISVAVNVRLSFAIRAKIMEAAIKYTAISAIEMNTTTFAALFFPKSRLRRSAILRCFSSMRMASNRLIR